MQKLVILRGLPASGKSVTAAKYVQQGFKRINADDLRMSIDNGIYSKTNEDVINATMMHMLDFFLSLGYSVVLDNTNLNPYKVLLAKDVGKRHSNVQIEIVDINTPLATCLERDLNRTQGRVGKEVIMRMYKKWFKNDQFPEKPL